ncbi:hypothetical protein ACZ11_07605 [Lysinibacillus xylanilyticus]|uniref:Uncharacterized protein n=1 Tax=Lysinibacillus xylanilyticus TaxID=582475 RepID=A0A0K9FCU1_9BACI|nr:hypothetical protein [Lysinibacillus xylanilyticus]KMY32027.1 hypothetical protein ACZ11_07605 [Lysinibacillus xylanilyticus]
MTNNKSENHEQNQKQKKIKWKFEWRNQDWVWLMLILSAIIYFLLTFRLADNIQVVDLFSFISSSVSIALALVAILIALNQSRDNEQLSSTLKTTMAIMNEKLSSVDEKVNKIDPDVLSRVLQQKIDNVITDISRSVKADSGISPEEIEEKYLHELNQLKLDFDSVIENINNTNTVPFLPLYNIGDEVIHKKWGRGTVTDVRGYGDSTEVDIRFDEVGVKRLLAKFAPIMKMG